MLVIDILDTEKKIMMVLDPTETDPMDEMKIKHEALAKKFQHRFYTTFNDFWCVDGHLCPRWWRNTGHVAGACDCLDLHKVVVV